MSSVKAKRLKLSEEANDNDNDSDDSSSTVGAGDKGTIMSDTQASDIDITQMREEMSEMKRRLEQLEGIESRCKYLEGKCASLERSVQLLAEHQNYEYKAPPIDSWYWEERGFNAEYIERTEAFLQNIKKETFSLWSGENCGGVQLDWNPNRGGGSAVLLYDEALLPHWKNFTDALQVGYDITYPEFELVSISNIQLSSDILDLLLPAMKTKNIGDIELDNNHFANAREGIDFVIKVAESIPTLRSIVWIKNPIHDINDALHLVDKMNDHPGIDNICLWECCREGVNGYELLCSILKKNKKCSEIYFRHNNVRTMGDTFLSDFLKSNPPLKCLNLENNHLNDDDMVLIAEALKENTNLKSISLDDNPITEDRGIKALRKAVFDETDLNSVASSNHTCCIHGPFYPRINDFEPDHNRCGKIYYLLSCRNREQTNCYHLDLEFGDDCRKFAPYVIESVEHYAAGCDYYYHSDIEKPLSIVYEIMRNWKMPQLYENYSSA